MTPIVSSRVALGVMTAISLVVPGHAFPDTEGTANSRDALVVALETLMTDGVPRHVDHDAGEWLQAAVNDAIKEGDADIERLALRAAAPVVARIVGPVRSIDEPPALEIAVFLTSPATTSAQQIDPTLPDIPFSAWLDRTFADLSRDPQHDWRVMYCADRTEEPDVLSRAGDLCSVMHFQDQNTVGQIWIRTGQVSFSSTGPEWRICGCRVW